ncbi:uncharacterized protein LOC132626997 isoform X2 [Lycium barbarum]|uniref:uncharacterized protein LOC132626997 isoform X2 n=1 Tax=Lycium barbarum TaxID=112863 RepID=UPI00293EE8AA|nr:uncharacterized protein LOC132626997 isoform X2 [Lycium barbarum]
MQKTQVICSIFLVLCLVAATKSMGGSEEAKVYIVHTEKPEDQEPEEYHIKTLASVLGRATWGLANRTKRKTPFTWNRAYVKANSCDSITKPIYLDMCTGS